MFGSSHARASPLHRTDSGCIYPKFFKPETSKRCRFARVTIGSPKRRRFDSTCCAHRHCTEQVQDVYILNFLNLKHQKAVILRGLPLGVQNVVVLIAPVD